ncbi:signal peptidase complex subunit 1 family protein [Vibrio sp. SCSIO 43136]|uniref:signal peptidase complex subunit 1 family protein n=1 Tax=Vibrio sp. SCSIO 43136 TaxID=2819101 RepID=UPI002075F76A|nr:signal peptidase complex subunit 1 family protein [Vibrio sp. SCSIO 43136]USD67876.1 hypothetical protein J4N39_16970 [Vibrio sp. SCSIO 43136]
MFSRKEPPYLTSAGLKVESSVIALSKIDKLYVKDYHVNDKIKRAALIAFVIGFVLSIAHPIYVGLPGFVLTFLLAYLRSPKFELRAEIHSNDDQVAPVDTGLHHTIDRSKYDTVVEKFNALKAYEELTSHHDDEQQEE